MSIIPQALGDFRTWVSHQKSKRPAAAAQLKLSTDEVKQADEADEKALRLCQEAEEALSTSAAKVGARDQYLKQYNTATSASIARHKTNPLYTEALGKDCQWLSDDPSAKLAPDALKSSLSITRGPEGFVLKWSKLDQDGVKVFRRRAGETAWQYLAFDSRSPYIDTETGLAGTYEYYVQLMRDDHPVGQASDIVTAVHG
jgi:uncharacterized short protein YbdD (DUF466 family)